MIETTTDATTEQMYEKLKRLLADTVPDFAGPLAGVLADDLEAQLATGVRKVLAWTDRHGTVPVPFAFVEVGASHAAIDPFFNANTPDDVAAAERLARLHEQSQA